MLLSFASPAPEPLAGPSSLKTNGFRRIDIRSKKNSGPGGRAAAVQTLRLYKGQAVNPTFLLGADTGSAETRLRLLSRTNEAAIRNVISEELEGGVGDAAVRLFAEMSEQGFSFDAPPTAMLHLTDPPELAVRVPLTAYLMRRAGGEKPLLEFIAALRDFAEVSRFTGFFEAHAGTYGEMIAAAERAMGDVNYFEMLESYYGMRQNSYSILLAPLFHQGGNGPRIDRSDGELDIFNIVGPLAVENGLPTGSTENFRHTATQTMKRRPDRRGRVASIGASSCQPYRFSSRRSRYSRSAPAWLCSVSRAEKTSVTGA